MKLAINLLPPEPEKASLKIKEKTLVRYSMILLTSFLIVNLAIFGFYWFLTVNTADKLTAIKQEESKIASLATRESLYREIGAKLQFLASVWPNKINHRQALEFSQSLIVADTTITEISLKQDFITLTVQSKNSDSLENFLNGVMEKGENNQIKEVKIISSQRDKEGAYISSIGFRFLKYK